MPSIPANRGNRDTTWRALYVIGWPCTSASWRTPDLTPIEEAFAKLKALLRQAAARTAEALAAAFWAALAAITPADAHGYFTHCGYPAQPHLS